MKKNKKALLRQKADKLYYEVYVKDYCEACGRSGVVLQVHHFYYKSSYGHLRYWKDNAVTLCVACHFMLHHQDPKRVEDRIIKNKGEKWHKKLQKDAYIKPEPSYRTVGWYQDNIDRLRLEEKGRAKLTIN